jgi:hypothetical protein
MDLRALHAHRATLRRYARDTWASLVAMTDPDTGLPADKLRADGTASVQTSITNVGCYLWSTLVADRLRLVSHAEAVARLDRTLTTLGSMERHEPSGQFYNWYEHRTGAKLTIWPPTGGPLIPILSSVDNGWLATGLQVIATSVPEVAAKAEALFASMDFGFYYDPADNRIAVSRAPGDVQPCRSYDTIVSESRIATYIGIATGRIPGKAYFGTWRTFPAANHAQAATPIGVHRTYLGMDVFEGAYEYDGVRIVPSWGGSMFEALMPTLFVPEDEWAPDSWAVNHQRTVAAQIHHGLVEAGYGYWGLSPANVPSGGYAEYGVHGIGMNADGYLSNGTVTPYASFLALRWAPVASLANLARLERHFPVYGEWGFHDSVDVRTGMVSGSYLAVDQGIIMAAIGNALGADMLRHAFASEPFRLALEPLISIETFEIGPSARHSARAARPDHAASRGTPMARPGGRPPAIGRRGARASRARRPSCSA